MKARSKIHSLTVTKSTISSTFRIPKSLLARMRQAKRKTGLSGTQMVITGLELILAKLEADADSEGPQS